MRPDRTDGFEVSSFSPERENGFGSVLSPLQDGIREAIEGLFQGLDQSVTAPLREALHTAARSHRHLLEVATFPPGPGEGAPPPGVSGAGDPRVWARVLAYRTGVLTQVLEPLRESLLSKNAASLVEAEWASFRVNLLRLAASLPEEVTQSEPPDLYLRREGDGFGTLLGKGVVRTRRRIGARVWGGRKTLLRLVGADPSDRPARVHTIPIRNLAQRWIKGPIALALEPLREDLHQHYAIPLAALETAVARWIREWPPAEALFDRETAYLSHDLHDTLTQRLAQMGAGDQVAPAEIPADEVAEPPPSLPLPSATEVAHELDRVFDLGPGLTAPRAILDGLDHAFQVGWSALLSHVRASGTFMTSSPSPQSVRKAQKSTRIQDERSETWIRWHRALPDRLVWALQVLRLREEVTTAREQLVAGIAEEAIIPLSGAWLSSSKALRALGERGDAALDGALSSRDSETLATEVGVLLEEGLKALESLWLLLQAPDGIEKEVHDLADETSTGLAKALRGFPVSLAIQAVQTDGETVDPAVGLREVRPREIAQQVLDILRLEGLRNTPEPVLEALSGIRAEADKLPDVLRFNLEAALEELSQLSSKHPGSEIEEAGSLAREGLTRTEEGVNRLLHALPSAWIAFTKVAEDLLEGASQEMHARISSEGGVQEQMVGFGARIKSTFSVVRSQLRKLIGRWYLATRRANTRLFVRLLRVVRLGKKVVGATPAGRGEGDRALAIIRQAPELLSGLPLAYRRLFSFQPLTDEGLLKGRSEETAWVKSRFESWKFGLGSPGILTGPVGAGHTSFFNILSTSVFSGMKVHRIELAERIAGEERLATRLAEEFGFPHEAPWDLPRLTRSVLRGSSRKKPWVVLTERLEHLFLRTPGGTDLFEDFLSFQVQTSESVFWLSSMSGAAWKLVAKTEPRGASLVLTYPLSSPSREQLEELILARHRRSGLPLEYRAPQDLNPLVRRRLRLSRNEKARQKLLQTEFFDRLFRLSEESIALGILHWLRSTDFRFRKGRLVVTPPSEIRYAFLDDLDLELDFALKAFLEHGSLTLEEYREVFRSSGEDSLQTFEALRSKLLLEPTGSPGETVATTGKKVEEGERYRIPVLLSQMVAQRLKNRNILH